MIPGLYDKDYNLILDWEKLDINIGHSKVLTDERAARKVLSNVLHKIESEFFNSSHYTTDYKIVIPEGVTKIGINAFYGCDMINSVVLPSTLEIIDEGAFCQCVNLKEIIIPDGVIEIRASAFSECDDLKEINIPNSVTKIGQSAFSHCRNLKKVNLPCNIKEILYNTFEGCYELCDIKIPDGVQKIGSRAFMDTKIPSVILPDSVLVIDEFAFYGCDLEKIKLSRCLQHIGACAFKACKNLTEVMVPKMTNHIGREAFGTYSNLEMILASEYTANKCPEFYKCYKDKIILTNNSSIDELINELISNGKSFKDVNKLLLGINNEIENI